MNEGTSRGKKNCRIFHDIKPHKTPLRNISYHTEKITVADFKLATSMVHISSKTKIATPSTEKTIKQLDDLDSNGTVPLKGIVV